MPNLSDLTVLADQSNHINFIQLIQFNEFNLILTPISFQFNLTLFLILLNNQLGNWAERAEAGWKQLTLTGVRPVSQQQYSHIVTLFLPIVIAAVAGKYIHSILFYSILCTGKRQLCSYSRRGKYNQRRKYNQWAFRRRFYSVKKCSIFFFFYHILQRIWRQEQAEKVLKINSLQVKKLFLKGYFWSPFSSAVNNFCRI